MASATVRAQDEAAAPTPQNSAIAAPRPWVKVFIESDNPKTELHGLVKTEVIEGPPSWQPMNGLYSNEGYVRHWGRICDTPCGQVIQRRPVYRIEGPGIPRSYNFTFTDERADTVRLRVEAGSFRNLSRGILLSLGGGLVLAGGIAALALTSQQDSNALHGVSYLLMASGIGITVGGVIWASSYRKTIVRQENGVTVPKVSIYSDL